MKSGYMESGFQVGDLVQIGTENRDVFSLNNAGENAHIIEICQCSLEDIGRGKRPVKIKTISGNEDFGFFEELKLIEAEYFIINTKEELALPKHLSSEPKNIYDIANEYYLGCVGPSLQERHRKIRILLRSLEIKGVAEFDENANGWKISVQAN